MSSLLWDLPGPACEGLGAFFEEELGVALPGGAYHTDWHVFLERCYLKDLLDIVTLANTHFIRKGYTSVAKKWVSEVGRIIREENLRYRIDPGGGVHFSIDQEFESARSATISALQESRYSNVVHGFEQAYSHLAVEPPDGKNAIRAVFAAAEGLFRLMFPDAPRLTSNEIDKCLSPFVQKLWNSDATALGATSKLLASFKDWVDAAHFYRHEPGKEAIAQPPLPLAINLVSLGATYIRWLAEMDAITRVEELFEQTP
jgi:hypothetical protein